MSTTSITVRTATSVAWFHQPSPAQMPRSSDTAYVNGTTRETACASGGSASIDTKRPDRPSMG